MVATVAQLMASGERTFSFEFFPPKTDEGEAQLWAAIEELEPLRPAFIDVTYRAGDTARDRTLRVVERLAGETDFTVVAHLTCVGATRQELRTTIKRLADAGVRNVLALRGDMPQGPEAAWEPPPGGLQRAEDLVRLLHEEGEFCVGVAAYPEAHPESPDREADVKYLARKCAAGADFAITQFFFDPADYFALVDRAREIGCDLPIIPGVMPVTNVRQITRLSQLSGSAFPPDLAARLHAVEKDPEAVRAIGVDVATDLCRRLLDGGAPGSHFYTFNRSTATREIHRRLHT